MKESWVRVRQFRIPDRVRISREGERRFFFYATVGMFLWWLAARVSG
ncbi:MAG: hypothetical protein ABIM40_01725 [Pseudomonadota bacterium]